MKRQSASETRLSLLGRLQKSGLDNAPAWREFVAHYCGKIEAWCRHWGLQEADVQDVTQTVLVKLATKMRSFVYQPGGSFRAWLKTLARHAWIDFVADRKRGGAGDTVTALEELPARDDLEARLAEAFDMEVLEVATSRVRQRVAEATWEAFRLTALDGLSAAEAAARLGMSVANVFKAKSNVRKMLQEEINLLEGGQTA
jgi:RNA polymerase sigma-70 factor (ECF subfamily)